MAGEIVLENEQIELLGKLVHAARNVPPERRQKFQYRHQIDADPRAILTHEGFPSPDRHIRAHFGDIEALAHNGLVSIEKSGRHNGSFDILPLGYRYYANQLLDSSTSVQRVEATVRSFLCAESFRVQYATAYEKWRRAEELLWASDSSQQLSTIGHLCREAMQAFATVLFAKHASQAQISDPAKVVAKLKAVIEASAAHLGTTEREFLDALLPYWGTVSDLVQRQEHAGQKEGRAVTWGDARRAVFQTAVVMFEVADALQQIHV